ncbi:MAG: caspase family protein [Pseudomonadota bacterium]
MRLSTILSLVVFIAGLTLSAPANAERYAVLIGVSQYQASVLDYAPKLSGPGNDVALIHSALVAGRVDPERAIVLTDGPVPEGVAGVLAPTRSAIMAALNRVADQVGPGDDVIVFLAGHGSQIPSLRGETDGFDEIFLPSDFEIAKRAGGVEIRNHIRDDEFGTVIERMLQRGARVWMIADTCHSGTLARASADLVPRFLPLSDENIVDGNPPLQSGRVTSWRGQALSTSGSFAGFYATPAESLAFEAKIPEGQLGAGHVHGVFTQAIVAALSELEPGGDLRRLSSLTRQQIWRWGAAVAGPLFSGALDSPVKARDGFNLTSAASGLEVVGGVLQGLRSGQILGVSDRQQPNSLPLFYARVTAIGADRARIQRIENDVKHPSRLAAYLRGLGLDPARRTDRWLADQAIFLDARVLPGTTPVPRIRLALPKDPQAAALLRETILSHDLDLELVPPDNLADLRAHMRNARLWITRGAEPLQAVAAFSDASVSLTQDQHEPLVNLLRRRAWAARLMELARLFDTESGLSLDVSLSVQRYRDADPCTGAPNTPEETLFVGGRVHHCDVVHVDFRNKGSQPLDVSAFYIGPLDTVYYLDGYPDGAFFGLRVPAKGQARLSYRELTDSPDPHSPMPTGRMHLALFASPSEPGSEFARDLRHFASPPMPGTDALRADASILERILMDHASGLTRGDAASSGKLALGKVLELHSVAPTKGVTR